MTDFQVGWLVVVTAAVLALLITKYENWKERSRWNDKK